MLPVRPREEAGHLHQPGRRLLTQQGTQAYPRWAATELSQGFQDGQRRFSQATVLDALPRREPHRGIGGHLGRKGLHRRGFADPQCARAEEDLTHTLTCLRQRRVQAWPKARGFYPNVTVFLRDFYGTFMTSLPPSDILSSVKAGDACSVKP